MNMSDFTKKYFADLNSAIISLDCSAFNKVVSLVEKSKKKSGKIILIGNGGSAAIASHLTIDFTKAANIRAINFNESSLLTCFSNDYGYEHWAEMALEFYADNDDIVILISSSGQSENIINAGRKAKKMGLSLITLSGFLESNPLKELGDINLWVDSSEYNVVENTHQIWLLAVVDYLIESNNQKS
jgi:D-sedoheptulose 7-phosphate isomerase